MESKTKDEGTKTIQERFLTVSVVEDDDAPLFGFGLLWIHHGGANNKIH